MEIGSILLISALLILSLFYVARPIIDGPKHSNSFEEIRQEPQELIRLIIDRDRLLGELKELDFDHTAGKITEPDYIKQRNFLVQTGADLLQRIDALNNSLVKLPGLRDNDLKLPDSVQKTVEAGSTAVHNHSGTIGATPHSNFDDELEVMIANRRRNRSSKADGFCPKCGAPHQVTDHFCPKCGENFNWRT